MLWAVSGVPRGAREKLVHLQEALETPAIKRQELARCLASHCRGARLVSDKSELAEIVTCGVIHDLHSSLSGNRFALFDDVKLLAFLSLAYDDVASFEGLATQSVCQLGLFVIVHRSQQRHLGKERVIPLAFLLCRVLHNVVERVPVQLPKHTLFGGFDRGRARAIVQQRELSGHVPGLARFHDQLAAIVLLDHTVELPGLDNEEEITIFTLIDDALLRIRLDFFHRADHDRDVGLVEG
mmetsp:Transcript_15347/g.42079  ORF Transcript_15347/g.42079 Transcript_15347/m.42079 type:complete len:239 (-) Transcript_15347:615-1331(-)